MRSVRELHDDAMSKADEAIAADRRGDRVTAQKFYQQAFQLEREAADRVSEKTNSEPTRSILLRSAAQLALDANLTADSERLIHRALLGTPPDDIAEELRDLYEQVTFCRHLSTRGIILQTNEIQMSFQGRGVGFGVIESDLFLDKVGNFQSIVRKEVERKKKLPLRTIGAPTKAVREAAQIFLIAPRPGSFAVSLRIGTRQDELPGIGFAEEVVDSVIACLEDYEKGEAASLQEKMPEHDYRQIFVSHARELASSDEQITVGFTTERRGVKREVALTKKRNVADMLGVRAREATNVVISVPEIRLLAEAPVIKLRGWLRRADKTQSEDTSIGIQENDGRLTILKIHPSVVSDIVRPYWDFEVEVTCEQRGQEFHFLQIDRVPEDSKK